MKSESAAGTNGIAATHKSCVTAARKMPYTPKRRAPARSPLPKSCEAKLEMMNETPIGRTRIENVFSAPAVVAASAASPRLATMSASHTPTTTWLDRETMIGSASERSVRIVGGRRFSAACSGVAAVASISGSVERF